MVGICGVVGDREFGLDPLVEHVAFGDDERRSTYQEEGIAVCVASHPHAHEDQPAIAADGSLVWVQGEPYGFEDAGEYRPRTDDGRRDAEYCADRYDEHGLAFVDGLNGEFSGVLFDPGTGSAHLFTDRIGSRPLFVARTEDGSCLFSSRIQAIGCHPGYDPAFDRAFLAEFFGVQKAFGTATPLSGVSKVGPASVLAVDATGAVRDRRVYWRPTYNPVERSAGDLAEELLTRLRWVFDDRLREDRDYGVLLSGGTDSRLVLAAAVEAGYDPTAFHMTNWESRETRAARRAAEAAGVPFRTLTRDAGYHATLLESAAPRSNFVGVFDESIAAGFADELSDVDVLLTGYLGDTTFGTYPLYRRRLPGGVELPLERPVGSPDEYVRAYLRRYPTPARLPAFLDAPADLETIVAGNVRDVRGGIEHHGVEYPSLRALQLCEYYPLTNQFASANGDSLRAVAGHWSPFFDARVLDLHLSVRASHRLRRDPVAGALTEFPDLAAIPHGELGIPVADLVDRGPAYLLRRAAAKVRDRRAREVPPKPYLDHGPWMDEAELIRQESFVADAIERHADRIAALPFLDRAAIDRVYRDHLSGEDHWRALYALLTLLETPVAARVAGE